MSKPKVNFHRLKMSVPERRGFEIIPFADILWLQASKQYTQVVLRDDRPARYVYEPLNELELFLPPVFFRCHRSVIVNLCHVQSSNRQEVNVYGHILPISKKKIPVMDYLLEKCETLTFPLCRNCDNCPDFCTCENIRPFTAIKIP